jgi:hypothetical protein
MKEGVMWFFKEKSFKEVYGGAWGHLVNKHQIDVDTLHREMRCVERQGSLDGGLPVTFLRVFRLPEAEKKGVNVSGWETFDKHPDLIAFEGYLTQANEAFLEAR